MDHVFRPEHGLLGSDDLVDQRVIAAMLLHCDELEESNADAGLVVPQESRNWNPNLGPLVGFEEDDIVALVVLGDVLAAETSKAFLGDVVAVLGDIDALPSVEYLSRGQSDRASKNATMQARAIN